MTIQSYPNRLAGSGGFHHFTPNAATSNEVEFHALLDTKLRYIGYADEFGEALHPSINGRIAAIPASLLAIPLLGKLLTRLKPQLKQSGSLANRIFAFLDRRFLLLTYLISMGYAAGAVTESAWKAYQRHNHESAQHQQKRTLEEAVDGTLFHTVATVFGPALILKYLHKALHPYLQPEKLPGPLRRIPHLPTIIAVGMVPVIGKPVDIGMDWLLDNTYRKLINRIHPSKGTDAPLPRLHQNRARAVSPNGYESNYIRSSNSWKINGVYPMQRPDQRHLP